jgi:hypothetical protein
LLSEINKLVNDFRHKANFLFVYILEAHAADEWQIKELPVEIPQHKSVNERLIAANNFISEYALHPDEDMQVVVDNEDNVFVDQYIVCLMALQVLGVQAWSDWGEKHASRGRRATG